MLSILSRFSCFAKHDFISTNLSVQVDSDLAFLTPNAEYKYAKELRCKMLMRIQFVTRMVNDNICTQNHSARDRD